MNPTKYKILVVQRRMTHYRTKFFELLRQEMYARDCELILAYGVGTSDERLKGDEGDISWAKKLTSYYFFKDKVCWQPFSLRGLDCVVITSENKLIYNLFVQFFSSVPKVILWGHGANLQGEEGSFREKFKNFSAKHADWWLGYTEISRGLIRDKGFPTERVTILNNAVDTVELSEFFKDISKQEIISKRDYLGVTGKRVGIYIGSLYREKRIQFMLDAALKIRNKVPDFEFLIVGDGPDKHLVIDYCNTYPWMHYMGVKKGREKVMLLSLSDVLINPGAVGLGVLDSFVCRVPLLTVDNGMHGPEITYLKSGYNGIITEDSFDSFVNASVLLLSDNQALETLKRGCEESSKIYTIENMVRNFASGIVECLNLPTYR